MVLSVVETEPASSKPSVCGGVRIFTDDRRNFGPLAPSSIKASLLHLVRAEGLVDLSPKLVRVIESTRADKISHNLSSGLASSSRARFFMSCFTSALAARRGC